ncbi:Nicotinate-nucleotide--dimethylbenzimidazole phosphoribosyltransferase [Streptomyces hirsutus]
MSALNLDDFTDLIERPDGGVRRDAEARRERQIVPPGSLGRLDELGEWLAAAQCARCRCGRSNGRGSSSSPVITG